MSATPLSKLTFPWALPGSQFLLPNQTNEKGQYETVEEALGLELEDYIQFPEAKNELYDLGLVI